MSDEGVDKMIGILNVLDGFLSKSKYLAGDNVTIADLSLLGTISTLAVSCLKHKVSIILTFFIFKTFRTWDTI